MVLSLAACIPDPPTPTPPGGSSDTSQAELVSLLRELSLYGLPEDFDPSGKTPLEIVAAMNDPYAAYFTAEEFASYESDLQGNFVGIGVSILSIIHETLGDVIQVLVAFDGSPAKAAGITAGDILTHVDGVSISEVGYEAATDLLLGEAGEDVTITFVREGTSHTVTIARAACVKQTVFHRTYEKNGSLLGYVRITDFDAVTTSQFISAMEDLEGQNVAGVVFDLRFNGGGYLRTVCEMLAYLLPDGDLCRVDYHSELYPDYRIYAKGNVLYMNGGMYVTDSLGNSIKASHSLDIPMAVLTNGGTASAAELFTATLRDYEQENKLSSVTLVGENTFGKGCMQSTYKLTNGDYVKLTIALYNPPIGENYDGTGIAPEVEVKSETTFPDLYLKPDAQDAVKDAALDLLLQTN
jgi:carboxyl-terminal processing protease